MESICQNFVEVNRRTIEYTIVLTIASGPISLLKNIILVWDEESSYIQPEGIPISPSGFSGIVIFN